MDLDFSAAFPVRPFPEMVSADLAAKTDAAEAEDGNELKIIHPCCPELTQLGIHF